MTDSETFEGYLEILSIFPSGRIHPGTKLTVKGRGFSRDSVVIVNEVAATASDVRFIDAKTLEVTLGRPDVPRNREGVAVRLRLWSPALDRYSNTISVTLDTVEIIVLGDSVMWGQGLREEQKMHSLVQERITKQYGYVDVFCDMRAHSGAIIGAGALAVGPVYPPEVPTSFPTIIQQLDVQGRPSETVDFVFLNGGLNDLNVRNVLNPAGPSFEELKLLIEQYCYIDMKLLLSRVLSHFTHAKVIVTGYFPVLSEKSNLNGFMQFLKAFGTLTGDIIDVIAGNTMNEVFTVDDVINSFLAGALFAPFRLLFNEILTRIRLLYEETKKQLSRAVNEINAELLLQGYIPRVYFAQPPFGPENAAEAPEAWLFGLSQLGAAEDPVAQDRALDCERTLPIYDLVTREICRRASMGHPNEIGAEKYADTVMTYITF